MTLLPAPLLPLPPHSHSLMNLSTKTPYGASKLLVGQREGGNSINNNIDGARHSSYSMGERVWVNSSSSNAGSGSGRSSTLTGSSTTRTSSKDDEAIIADALLRGAMDLDGLHIIDAEPDGNCLFRAVIQQGAETPSVTSRRVWLKKKKKNVA